MRFSICTVHLFLFFPFSDTQPVCLSWSQGESDMTWYLTWSVLWATWILANRNPPVPAKTYPSHSLYSNSRLINRMAHCLDTNSSTVGAFTSHRNSNKSRQRAIQRSAGGKGCSAAEPRQLLHCSSAPQLLHRSFSAETQKSQSQHSSSSLRKNWVPVKSPHKLWCLTYQSCSYFFHAATPFFVSLLKPLFLISGLLLVCSLRLVKWYLSHITWHMNISLWYFIIC